LPPSSLLLSLSPVMSVYRADAVHAIPMALINYTDLCANNKYEGAIDVHRSPRSNRPSVALSSAMKSSASIFRYHFSSRSITSKIPSDNNVIPITSRRKHDATLEAMHIKVHLVDNATIIFFFFPDIRSARSGICFFFSRSYTTAPCRMKLFPFLGFPFSTD